MYLPVFCSSLSGKLTFADLPVGCQVQVRCSIQGSPGTAGGELYSKTVLGCKENRRYEMGVQKIVFRGRRPRKRITLLCYYYIPYFTHKWQINADL